MKRLYRSETDRWLGGVCGGLGEYLHIDPLWLRLLFVALTLSNGMGFVLYLLLWAFTPSPVDAGANQDQIFHRNAQEIRRRARSLGSEAHRVVRRGWSTGNTMLLAGAALVGVGVLVLLRNLGLLAWIARLWPLAVVAIGAVILLNTLKERV